MGRIADRQLSTPLLPFPMIKWFSADHRSGIVCGDLNLIGFAQFPVSDLAPVFTVSTTDTHDLAEDEACGQTPTQEFRPA